jgi:AcrR family transcriptional regulator
MHASVTMGGETSSKIIETAARLLRDEGPSAVTTRGVAEAAGVQVPTIYRHFGDKDGLLDAVAEHIMSIQVSAKTEAADAAAAEAVDPLEDFRAAWQDQLRFCLENPSLFLLLSDPERVRRSAAARVGRSVLESRVRRLATTRRLRVSEGRAVELIQAALIGAIQTLLSGSAEVTDTGLADELLEAVLARILTDAPGPPDEGTVPTAIALRAVAPQLAELTAGERQVLAEWLDRVIDERQGEA